MVPRRERSLQKVRKHLDREAYRVLTDQEPPKDLFDRRNVSVSRKSFSTRIISALAGCMIGSGFGFALCAALSLKYQWTWGVDAPDPILYSLHVNGVLIGLTALGLGLATVITVKVLASWRRSSSIQN